MNQDTERTMADELAGRAAKAESTALELQAQNAALRKQINAGKIRALLFPEAKRLAVGYPAGVIEAMIDDRRVAVGADGSVAGFAKDGTPLPSPEAALAAYVRELRAMVVPARSPVEEPQAAATATTPDGAPSRIESAAQRSLDAFGASLPRDQAAARIAARAFGRPKPRPAAEPEPRTGPPLEPITNAEAGFKRLSVRTPPRSPSQ